MSTTSSHIPPPPPAPSDPTLTPTPTPPPPLQPGPRALAFREVLHRALLQSLKACPYDSFSTCFPTTAKSSPGVLRQIHTQIIQQLEKLATDNFEAILERKNVVEKLNSLEEMIAEAKRRKVEAEGEGRKGEGRKGEVVSPSTLPPTQILSAHLLPLLLSAQTTLGQKLDNVTTDNERLMKSIDEQRREIRSLVTQVEKILGDVQEAVGVVGECLLKGEKGGIVEEDRLGEEEEEEEEEEDGEGSGEEEGNEREGRGGGGGERMEGVE